MLGFSPADVVSSTKGHAYTAGRETDNDQFIEVCAGEV